MFIIRRRGRERKSRTVRAGLIFPVGRVHRHLKRGLYAGRIGARAPVFLAAVLEYLAAESLDLAGTRAKNDKKQRITPRHIMFGWRDDEEFGPILGNVTIPAGGVLPYIHNAVAYKCGHGPCLVSVPYHNIRPYVSPN